MLLCSYYLWLQCFELAWINDLHLQMFSSEEIYIKFNTLEQGGDLISL